MLHTKNSSDVFTNLFPQFCLRKFLSLSNWKKKQISYRSKTVFLQFASGKRNHNKYSEIEIGETIWWICYLLMDRKTFTRKFNIYPKTSQSKKHFAPKSLDKCFHECNRTTTQNKLQMLNTRYVCEETEEECKRGF